MPTPGDAPCGSLKTLIRDAELVVRITGEVDLSLRLGLLAVAEQVTGYRGRTVIELSGVTFADATLAGFLAGLLASRPITVLAPNQQVRDLLRLCGLEHGLHIVS
jgi:anti-anti-sigma regulatory factor